jgi:DNA polymerase-1
MLDQLPFRRVICCDTEYTDREDGNQVIPVCLVARELRSGQEWRVVMGEFGAYPPFPTGKDSLFVAYSAPAELSVFAALGWPYPARILDLFAEHRNNINGLTASDLRFSGDVRDLWKQRGAAILHGLDPTPALTKEDLYDRIRDGPPFTHNELVRIADVCAMDVNDLAQLLERMLPRIMARPFGLEHAVNRGTSMIGIAAMQATGVPVDVRLYRLLVRYWDLIREQLVDGANREYGFFDGQNINQELFEEFLNKHRIAWPRTEKKNQLCTDKDTFKDMARGAHHTLLNPLRETLSTLGQMKLNDLRVGSDGRNRCSLKPFWAKTGRNQPSSSQYIFGAATWYRGLIKPGPGRAIIYADWKCQEIGIEAACSKDPAMLEDLQAADFYIGFGIRSRWLPSDATTTSHEIERGSLKTVALGVGYGMQKKSLAERLAITSPEAKALLDLHRITYPRFWQWNDNVVHYGTLYRKIWTVFGWELNVTAETKIQTMRNYLMQGNASEMLRIASYRFVVEGGLERGFLLAGPVHDALLVECAAEDIHEAKDFIRRVMTYASCAVLGGFALGVDFKVWAYPQRFMNVKRGHATWRKVIRYLARARKAELEVRHVCRGSATTPSPRPIDSLIV